MNKLGIMQGRLTAPMERVGIQFPLYDLAEITNEFDSAKYLKLDYIEWNICKGTPTLFMGDFYCKETVRGLEESTNILSSSICLDYLMYLDLKRNDLLLITNMTNWIVNMASNVGCNTLVIPIYNINMNILPIRYLISLISERYYYIKIAFEFLDSNSFTGINFINDLLYVDKLNFRDNAKVGCCFDIGNNCLVLGNVVTPPHKNYEGIIKEMENYYRHNKLSHIHIKERDKHGNTVQLGKGIIGKKGWREIFSFLKDINYSGDYTLQVARGKNGDEMNHIHSQVEFVKGLING